MGWWTHNTLHRWCIIELYTWNLYNFINQCHPNKFNKNKKNKFYRTRNWSRLSTAHNYCWNLNTYKCWEKVRKWSSYLGSDLGKKPTQTLDVMSDRKHHIPLLLVEMPLDNEFWPDFFPCGSIIISVTRDTFWNLKKLFFLIKQKWPPLFNQFLCSIPFSQYILLVITVVLPTK